MQKPVNILITGGHVTPAIATIEEIKKRYPKWQITFVGRKHSLEGVKVLSEEYRLIKDLNIPFIPITAGRLKRDGGLGALVALLKVPVGLIQAFAAVMQVRPDVVVSFGGYVALPVALGARILGVRVITHEQTTRPGLANRIIARIADHICISFPETKKMITGGNRITLTGLPLRSAVLNPPEQKPFPVPEGKPILFIVGGSTGSVSINNVVFASLPTLVKYYTVVHQVGRLSIAHGEAVARDLPKTLEKYYIPRAYFSAAEYSWAMHNAEIVIGRSGANTVTEIALSGAVAICIPLPWSAHNEQFHNAAFLVGGGSVILPQDKLTPSSLIKTVNEVTATIGARKLKAGALAMLLPADGAKRLVDVIEHMITPEKHP
ncbi:UDP-N-acetylglucosamine--N-acetylmuramyl-(pentapeptide) pyrophosphoryl-undecaprenol N-acetylglucosamine transferase [Candidatus Gottesmanbacteria bacterium]|nr:UDP-N-acetylglucosamine--N-acetylmuramyl-(pentapeptide) pyrophosphoryl-undecaprenol N-acetylglucosamine transferase [Candidatus Gottesmanbacteria bacterium]